MTLAKSSLLQIMRSKTLLKNGNSLIGRKFVNCSVGPFLRTGTTSANFSLLGNMPAVRQQ